MTEGTIIPPHGGTLTNAVAPLDARGAALSDAASLPSVTLDDTALADLHCLATGVYSPLEGYLTHTDYESVVHDMRLRDGTLWSIPVTLAVREREARGRQLDEAIALRDAHGTIVGTMHLQDVYRTDRTEEARRVYGTTDERHPGVATLLQRGPVQLGGPVTLLRPPEGDAFGRYRLSPADTRRAFADRGWRTVVAFQTRNPIHRAHEYLTKTALETVDGLLLHPLVGSTKSDDVPATVRLRCYETLVSTYYPPDRTLLAVYPAAMRYAGPREAILHAISRQNHGCSHFIVGRDHAGVGSYYGTYDAQRIFETLAPHDLAIGIMAFEHAFYCRACGAYGSRKTCPHASDQHVHLSGSRVRELLAHGDPLPLEFTRPEIAQLLSAAYEAQPPSRLPEPAPTLAS